MEKLVGKSHGAYDLALSNDLRVYTLARQTKSGPNVPDKDRYPQSAPIAVTFTSPKSFAVHAPNDSSGVIPTNAYTVSRTPRSITLDLPPKVLLIRIIDDN